MFHRRKMGYWIANKCLNLTHIKRLAQMSIQSPSNPQRPCSLMLLSNLAEPEWISVQCSEKLLYFVLCTKKKEYGYGQSA